MVGRLALILPPNSSFVAMASPGQQPLVVLAAAASSLLARALGACLTSSAAPEEHTVVLELHQSPERSDLLGLRVCDDGVPLPTEAWRLERCVSAGLARLLVHPMFADSTLLVQTTGLEEVVVRRYSFTAAAGHEGALAVADAGAAAKPPGSNLRGSVFEAALLLQPQEHAAEGSNSSSSSARAYVQQLLAEAAGGTAAGGTAQLLLASAEEAVSCLQQLLGMLRVLAPPVRLLMRLSGVTLKAPDGSLQPVSGSRRMDLQLDARLPALTRFKEGMSAEFLLPPAPAAAAAAPATAATAAATVAAAAPTAAEAAVADGGEHALRSSVLPARDTPGLASDSSADEEALPSSAADAAETTAAAPAAAAAEAGANPGAAAGTPGAAAPLLTFLGVGEAGWGCPGAAQHFRGCKWTARAGVVMTMPDHARLAAAAAAAAPTAGAAGSSDGCAGAPHPFAPNQAPPPAGRPPTPVFLFRSWGMQFEGQQQAVKGVERCDWTGYGFQLERAEGSAEGPISAILHCAQPESGASLMAAVVHLVPREYRGAAEGKKPPALSASYEARLVRAALEAALSQLKPQCPAVLSSRRERSLARALPLISKSLAGILLQSEHSSVHSGGGAAAEEGSVLHAACGTLDCQPEGLHSAVAEVLDDAVGAAMRVNGAGGSDDASSSGDTASKRARKQERQELQQGDGEE